MANDPNRDILPVKENLDRVPCDRIEPHLVSRYKRPELEDRFIKLYEENNELKRLHTVQDGKIKKLGTKLARHLRDQNGPQQLFAGRQDDAELEMKILELERENYALKDKNTVLKQQLASHSRQHMAAHRSPVVYHRSPSSARLSLRQASVPNIHEDSYTLSNRHSSSELQLHDAEAHIAALGDEIKHLQDENKSLRIEIEKTKITNQKAQDIENIEIIKLRQQKKQLDAQLRSSEHSQKLLKQDLARLQTENEDALLIIAEKQNEIIDLHSKLDDARRVSLELQENKETVADLMRERDILKEQCEALMLTIREKSVDAAFHADLKRQLSVAKSEAAGLRQELEFAKISYNEVTPRGTLSRKPDKNDSSTQTQINHEGSDEASETWNSQINSARSMTISDSPYDIMQQLAKARNAEKKLNVETKISHIIEHNRDNVSPAGNFLWSNLPNSNVEQGLTAAAERLNLQREADCLRELLRAQTQRCDLQDGQIIRMQQELKMKEERYKDVFQQRDLFFRLLDKDKVHSARTVENEDIEKKSIPESSDDSEECGSQCTYIKRNGTYTKSSPIKTVTDDLSPIKSPTEKVLAITSIHENPPPISDDGSKAKPIPIPRKQKGSSISVTILWVKLENGCNILLDPSIKAIYVDFTILSKSSQAFETPQALPKPQNDEEKLVYNFTAEILWDENLLKNLKSVKNQDPQGDCIVFNIVSEPAAEESASEVECPIVGLSMVSFYQFSFVEADEELLLPVYEIGKERKCCGTLAVRLSVPSAIFHEL